MAVDFSVLTETPGGLASQDQLRRMFTRYHFAREQCRGKKVLELACAAGQGLRYIERAAEGVIGGDYSWSMLHQAKVREQGTSLLRLDAQNLPFKSNHFDVVILFEAVYYLEKPEFFVSESRRVLKNGGMILLCFPNRSLPDFHPSPHSFHYYSPPEIRNVMEKAGFELEMFGDSPVNISSSRDRLISGIKKAAVRMNLIPGTLRGRALLKRMFLGRLIPIPDEIEDNLFPYSRPVRIDTGTADMRHRVLFAVATKI